MYALRRCFLINQFINKEHEVTDSLNTKHYTLDIIIKYQDCRINN